jgi:hypothetical protein
MIKKLLGILFATLLIFGSVATGSAALLFSDNFDSENGGVGVLNYNSFANWTVSDGTVDLIGNGFFDFLPGNGLYVDLDGSSGNAGMMTSNFTLGAGTYQLSFDLAGNHRNDAIETTSVVVNMGVFSKTYSLNRLDPFQTFTETFTIASSITAALSFEGIGADNIGMLLDNVEISSSSVPEPATATLLLLGSGIIGLTGFRKKFKSKRK